MGSEYAEPVAGNVGIEDTVIIERCKNGDVASFNTIVEKYNKRIFNIAYRMLNNYADANDVTQNTFIKAFESVAHFENRSSFYTWLYRIAINESLTLQRKKRITDARSFSSLNSASDEKGKKFQTQDPNPLSNPAVSVEAKETMELVQEALMSLEGDFKSVIVLRDVEGLNYSEIGEVLNMSLGTVKSKIHRARLLLREKLKGLLK